MRNEGFNGMVNVFASKEELFNQKMVGACLGLRGASTSPRANKLYNLNIFFLFPHRSFQCFLPSKLLIIFKKFSYLFSEAYSTPVVKYYILIFVAY